MLWIVGTGLVIVWFFLTFILNKKGLIHLLLILGFSLLVIQYAAYRKTKYHRKLSKE